MFSFFAYLRRKTCEAIVGGCEDAMTILSPDDPPAGIEDLRQRLAAAVSQPRALEAAPGEEVAGKGKRR